ncbi:MAG: VIT and VWA domain-containing protein [Planctomycetes bacterium]|nr:VIT and VWA domain-containing protein [Planctomycetota bacterium]
MRSAAALALALLLAAAAAAQDVPERSSVNFVAPQAWATARSHAGPAAFRVAGVEARVDIVEGVATTELLVRLENPSGAPQEARLLIAVPAGAAVRSFAFQGSSAEPSAELLPASSARETYAAIVSRLRDPALLEFAGTALVRSSVFPVPPGGTQAVRLVYEHVLPSEGGRLEYVLPRTQRLADSTVPFSLSGRIRSKAPVAAVYSPSHPVRLSRAGASEVRFDLDAAGGSEPGSFLLSVLPQTGDLSASLLACPDPAGGGHFLLLAALPPDARPASGGEVRREVTLVLDRSGSMSGAKIEQAKAALALVLQSLADGESFNLIVYNDGIERFAEAPVAKDRATEARARAYIAAIEAGGSTNLHGALLEALRPAPAPGVLPLVLLFSDGLPTAGVTSEAAIRRDVEAANRHGRRIFSFGVGHDVNAPLLDRISEVSRGALTCVLPGEDVEEKVSVLFGKLRGPVLTSPCLVALDEAGQPSGRSVSDLMPSRLPDVFRGDRLVVLGRYFGEGPLRLRLAGEFLGAPRAFELRFDLSGATLRNAFVPRLWASRRIAFLIDQIRQAGAEEADASVPAHASARPASARRPADAGGLEDPRTKELVDEIVRLSVKHGILTEYTAFLATEGTDLGKADVNAREAARNLSDRAVRDRSGAHGMGQQMNVAAQRGQSEANGRNGYFDENMNRVEIATVQQLADLSFFRRGDRWVDARIASRAAAPAPDEVVAFDGPRFREILARLEAAGRQGVLALGGEALFELDGKVVRVVFGEGK